MNCGVIDPGNTYLWLTLGGLLLGGGLSFVLSPRKRRSAPAASVLLSLAILSVLAAMFVAGFDFTALSFMLYWLAGSTAAGYLGVLFWKAAGLPLLFILVLFISGTWYSLYGWLCVVPGAEVCTYRTISEGSDFTRIQFETPDGRTGIDSIESKTVYPQLVLIEFPDYFFITGSGSVYRFEGFSQSETDPQDAAGSFLLKRLLSLPGFSVSSGMAEAAAITPSIEYRIRFDKMNKPVIIRHIE